MQNKDDLHFLKALCKEISIKEEDEKVKHLSRKADRIASLILNSDYPEVDIEIEKLKLKNLCKRLFPDKGGLYDLIYESRFKRLWEQFRGK